MKRKALSFLLLLCLLVTIGGGFPLTASAVTSTKLTEGYTTCTGNVMAICGSTDITRDSFTPSGAPSSVVLPRTTCNTCGYSAANDGCFSVCPKTLDTVATYCPHNRRGIHYEWSDYGITTYNTSLLVYPAKVTGVHSRVEYESTIYEGMTAYPDMYIRIYTNKHALIQVYTGETTVTAGDGFYGVRVKADFDTYSPKVVYDNGYRVSTQKAVLPGISVDGAIKCTAAVKCTGGTDNTTTSHKGPVNASDQWGETYYDKNGNSIGGAGGATLTCATCHESWSTSSSSDMSGYAGQEIFDANGSSLGFVNDSSTGTSSSVGTAIITFNRFTSGDTTLTNGCTTRAMTSCAQHGLSGTHYYCAIHNTLSTSATHWYSASGSYVQTATGYSGNNQYHDSYFINVTSNVAGVIGSANYYTAYPGTAVTVTTNNASYGVKDVSTGKVYQSGQTITMPNHNLRLEICLGLTVNPTINKSSIEVGQTAPITPNNSAGSTVTYTSANSKCVTVSTNGLVTGVGKGATTITVKAVA